MMEMNERMSKQLGLLGMFLGLVLLGLLLACGSSYNASSDGLVIVGSQGSAVLETFSFTLNSGHVSAIANSPNDTSNQVCILNGLPGAIVVDSTGSYAFAIISSNTSCSGSSTGIATFQISSGGNITQNGGLAAFAQEAVTINGKLEKVDVMPFAMSRDSAGKFLFVADRATTDKSHNSVPGAISVFAIGSGGSLTEVPGSPFLTPEAPLLADIASVAASPTTFPSIGVNGTVNSVCSVPGSVAPTSEYLYAVDANNYGVWEFSVDTSTGVLGNPSPKASQAAFFASDKIPMGVAVDPCDRFVYVSNSLTNKISAYTICIAAVANGQCPRADGSLVEISGSPFVLTGSANGPGPLVVDPYGNNVYVVDTLSNTVSGFKISPVTGSLAPLSPATVATGTQPTSIAIRGDDNWLFVTNYGSATVSHYSITPATGALSVLPTIGTDNLPWGVAVK
jgi:DNA-binding beta-propeller fold protein YncE